MESSLAPFSFRHKSIDFKKYMTYGNKKSIPITTLSISIITVILLSYMNTNNPNYVYAHSLPVTETPASNSIIKKGAPIPSKITIDFSERPDPNVSTIQVLNSKNERIDNSKFTIIGDHDRKAQTELNTKKLADGVYTVSWMTQSADDGHIARGSYVFGIGSVGPGGTAQGPSSGISTLPNNQQQRVQTVAVTSNLDGLIKWPLIVSEVVIVGGIFSHSFLWEKFGNRIGKKSITRKVSESEAGFNTTTIPWVKRFSLVLVIASATIIACATSLLFLQITELGTNSTSNSNYRLIFESILHGSSGISWLMHVITALLIMICILVNYYLLRKDRVGKTFKKSRLPTSQSILFGAAFVAGAVSIFANSMTSHNAAVNFIPSLAVFMDWLHLMAVSLWIGGLFYISVVLLHSLKGSETLQRPPQLFSTYEKKMQHELQVDRAKTQDSRNKISPTTYYLALLLPRFSLIATISLGVIGISGIYMAWIHLHTLSELFYSTYGNVLIIKLAIALPVVLLGTYHQIRIHDFITVVKNLGKSGTITCSESNNIKNSIDNKHLIQYFKNKDNQVIQKLSSLVARNKKNNHDNMSLNNEGSVFSRFGYTIKIESLLAVFLLLAASLLSITSPNSMSMASMPNMPNMPDMPTMSHTTSTSSSSQMAMTGNQMQLKNSTLVKQVKIMNVNTKMEINPFHPGFNTFKITFTDLNGKPYTKVKGAEMIFKNDKADIGPIVATMDKIQPNTFAITGGFIGQPGEWNIAMAAQRQADYDLNYDFTSEVANAPSASSQSSNMNMKMGNSISTYNNNNNNNNLSNSQNQEPIPKFDSFAILAIILSALLGIISWYTYQRSKQDLKVAIDRFEGGN